MLHKTQGISRAVPAHSSLGPDNFSLFWGKLAKIIPSRPMAQPQSTLAKPTPEQGHRTRLLCSFLRASEKDLDGGWCGGSYMDFVIYPILFLSPLSELSSATPSSLGFRSHGAN